MMTKKAMLKGGDSRFDVATYLELADRLVLKRQARRATRILRYALNLARSEKECQEICDRLGAMRIHSYAYVS